MDDPVPVRRALIGCLTIAVLVAGILVLVRPALFMLAPPRDDRAVIVAAAADLEDVPISRPVVLTRTRGWAGETDLGDGLVQHTLLISRPALGGVAAVNAASPDRDRCEVRVAGDRLADCEGRTWTFDGLPIEGGGPPLERFPVTEDGGALVVDMTRMLED